MARDLPEYRQQQSIQPAAQPSGIGSAMAEIGRSSRVVSELGAQLSQNSANEIARIKGLEAGMQPGRILLPSIGQSDAEFKDAYKKQEYAQALINGGTTLERLSFEALKNPTSQSLSLYNEESFDVIEQLSSSLTPENATAIKNTLTPKVLSTQLSIEEAIWSKGQKHLQENIKAAFEQTLKSINDLSALKKPGNTPEQNTAIDEDIAAIVMATENIIDDVNANPNLSESARIKLKESLKQAKMDANARNEMLAAIDEGRAEELLKEATNAAPTAANQQRADILYNTYRNYMAMTAASDDLLLTRLENKLVTGQLTQADLITAQEQVSPSRYADFEIKVSKWLEKHKEDNAAFDYYTINKSDPVAMSQLSGSQIDKAFAMEIAQLAQRQNAPVTWEQEAQLAATVAAPIPSYQKRLEAALRFGDSEQMAQAGMALKYLQANNPAGARGIDKDAKALSDLFNLYRLNTQHSAEEAAEKAKNDIYGVDEATKEARAREYKELYKNKGYNDESQFTKFVVKNLGAKEGFIFKSEKSWPKGLTTKVQELLPTYFERYGNWDVAVNTLFDDLKQVYRETNINNRDEIMAVPPESILPNVGYWIRNDKARAFKAVADAIQSSKASGAFAMMDVEWNNAPEFKDLVTHDLVPGDLKAKINGIERKILVLSDDITQLSTNRAPSWGFYYLDDNNIPMPVSDAREPGGIARWYPDIQALSQHSADYKDSKFDEATKAYNEFKKRSKVEDFITNSIAGVYE